MRDSTERQYFSCETQWNGGISLSLSVVLNVLGGLSKDQLALGVLDVLVGLFRQFELNKSKQGDPGSGEMTSMFAKMQKTLKHRCFQKKL